jgi:hypothetical protein
MKPAQSETANGPPSKETTNPSSAATDETSTNASPSNFDPSSASADAGHEAAHGQYASGQPAGDSESRLSQGEDAHTRSGFSAPADRGDCSGPDKAAAEKDDLDGQWLQLGFVIARSLRYDAKRRAFFERCNHLTRAISAIAGAGAVASAWHGSYGATLVAGLIVGIMSSLDLVFDFSKCAMVYDDLYKKYADLGIEVAGADRTAINCRLLSVKRLIVEREEPTLLAVLNVICANEEFKARDYDYMYEVKRLQKLFSQFIDIGQQKFKKIPATP